MKWDVTKKEIEVIKLISEGLSNAEIGQKLNISEETVKVHVRNILLKLELKNRAQIVAHYFNNMRTGQ